MWTNKKTLENYDKILEENLDKNLYRHRGLRKTFIMIILERVDYERTVYEIKDNDKDIIKPYLKKYWEWQWKLIRTEMLLNN